MTREELLEEVVKELVDDCQAMGGSDDPTDELLRIWPDLIYTYRHALAALESKDEAR